MKKVLAVGIATIDIINELPNYPQEDTEHRVTSQRLVRGGNATNLLAVLSQLGYQCHWAGTIAKDINYPMIKQDIENYSISDKFVKVISDKTNPTSYIIHSQETSSRSIVHFRDLPEYSYDDFIKIPLAQFDWIHFEGRNIDEVYKMQQYCKQYFPDITLSTEIEKNRNNIDTLFSYSDVLMFSKTFAVSKNARSAEQFLNAFNKLLDNKIASCAWGELGAAIYNNGKINQTSAYPIEAVVDTPSSKDTIGAGDSFNAALISALIKADKFSQASQQEVIEYACKVAAIKCSINGLGLKEADISLAFPVIQPD